ncbi:MAG: translation initiation factor IF-2 [Pseudomonadota bacterium]
MTMLTVDDLARDLKVRNEDLLRELVTMGFEVEGPESSLETDDPAGLMARLGTVLPSREVVEQRINRTVIRRRVKKKPAGSEPFDDTVAQPQRQQSMETRPKAGTGEQRYEAGKPRELPTKQVKKLKKPEPARIIQPAPSVAVKTRPPEGAPAPPEPALFMVEAASPSGETSLLTPVGEAGFQAGFAPEPVSTEEALSPTPGQWPTSETFPPSRESERDGFVTAPITTAGEAEDARADGPQRAPEPTREKEPARSGPHPYQPPEPGRQTPRTAVPIIGGVPYRGARPILDSPAGDEDGDDRSAKKKKKKDRRMQPAQIIGRVELKREPPREPVAPAPAPPSPTREPSRPPQQRPPLRPPLGPKPFRPATDAPTVVDPAIALDDEKRKKRKVKKVREVVEERVIEDEGKVRRRKEVLLKDDIYGDRLRPGRLKKSKKIKRKTEITIPKASKRRIKLPESVSVAMLAHKMSVKATEVIQALLAAGITATMNQGIDYDTGALIAVEFGFEAETAEQSEKDMLPVAAEETAMDLKPRPPVVTFMGHVDHGKTSLLDYIRKTHVTEKEAGGITQHLGAYTASLEKGQVVFLDTPGHEAFTAMRARGAQVTDFVVLVVAADDGVMEQTREAVNHARAAGVPILVAVNKMDKPEADKDKVLRQLNEVHLIPEEWGGETLFAYVSAKSGLGVSELLDSILLQAEIMELRANPDKPGTGTVVEARLDKGRGPVATVLVKEGTIRVGDPFVAGVNSGKVRAMFDHEGRTIKEAGPAMPAGIIGFPSVPEAGDLFMVVDEERVAKQIGEQRQQKQRQKEAAAVSGPTSMDDLLARMKEEPAQELNLIIKGDVQGSVEALREALVGMDSGVIKLKIIHTGVGAVTESDVMLAAASRAMIVGFNVRPTPKILQLAEEKHVDVRLYTVIYEVLSDVHKALEGLLAPEERENILGHAEIRQTFSVPKIGAVAGCHVTSGKIQRSNNVRLLRDGVVVFDGKIMSMKRFKDDVKEALEGYECGIGLQNFNDIKVGDVIEAYTIELEAAKLP